LLGKLRQHELKLNRVNDQKSLEMKFKSITLKDSLEKKASSEDYEDSDQDETLSLLTKKFSKFLKKKNRDRF